MGTENGGNPATTDWYRRTTWSDDDQRDFERRLSRARQKSQYLRVQAVYLASVGHHQAAIDLLSRFVADYPSDTNLAQAYLQLAESYALEGTLTQTLDAFDDALEAERAKPQVQTQAWLVYPLFVVEHELEERYSDAESVLDEFCRERDLSFPLQRYQFNASRALFAAALGKTETATELAGIALAAANETHSGYRYHPTVGLVESQSPVIKTRLKKLIAT